MVDVVSPVTRSRMMSGIGSKNTKPEMIVRKALFAAGYRYRLHRRDLPGAPDVVMSGKKIAIFVHGCFWHMHSGCRFAKLPATRPEFWKTKLVANVQRDRHAIEALAASGWRILTVWECATRSAVDLVTLGDKLSSWIDSGDSVSEIRGSQSI
jgi:DNA mismatch endonuclease (patch repair protein)